MLLDINSLQHARRSSTNEEKNIVLEPTPKSFQMTLPRSGGQQEWQAKLSLSPCVWLLGSLIPLLCPSKHHLIFPTDLSSLEKAFGN